MARLAPVLKQRFFDANNLPLAGGKVYSYVSGTTTPLATYADADGSTPSSNPVVLDSQGYADIFIGTGIYKFIVADANDVTQFTVPVVNGNLTTAADGIDGKTIIYGAIDPVPSDGNDGDSYQNTTSKYFFGPKAAGAWPAGFNMVGADGQGVPAAGTTHQILRKATDTDFDTEWVDLPPAYTDAQEIPSGTRNGVNLDFGLAHIPSSSAALRVYVNGGFRRQGAGVNDYGLNGQTITFVTAPESDQEIDAVYTY